MSSLDNERRAFEKECLKALAAAAKDSGWKKSGPYLFRVRDEYFLCSTLRVHVNDHVSRGLLEAKPMGIDPILWDILEMTGNNRQPLSLRANGAFTCTALPICEGNLEKKGDTPEQVAASFLRFCDTQAGLFLKETKRRPFTQCVEKHPNQVERGAYAITLVTSLILDGDLDRARTVAGDYAAGRRNSVSSISVEGKSFHEYALQWLTQRTKK